jgi:transposase
MGDIGGSPKKEGITMESMMNDLFTRALGIQAPWRIGDVQFSEPEKELHIYLEYPRGSRFRCPECGRDDAPAYDSSDRQWRHLNFFQYKAYLHASVPRVRCAQCGVKTVHLAWSRPGSGFTLLFEAFIMTLAREMPVLALARLIEEHDTRIWPVIHHYVQTARTREDYSHVRRIGIDETSRKRRHQYVTLFADLDQAKVIYATTGKDSTAVGRFSNDFHEHGGETSAIKDACCDMSPAFIEGVTQCLPNAHISFDRFHVMKIINEAVDAVRRGEQKDHTELKHSRYLWLRNPESLSEKQRIRLDTLSQLNLKTAQAYHIRLNLRELWDQPVSKAQSFLESWCSWAMQSKLAPIQEAAKTILRHKEGILNSVGSHITNGLLEGINSMVQAARNKARGYRSPDYFITIIYLIAGKLNFRLPI